MYWLDSRFTLNDKVYRKKKDDNGWIANGV